MRVPAPLSATLRAAPVLLLWACQPVPNYVSNNDINQALAQSRYDVVCVGVKMQDEETRHYAALKLQDIEDPVAAECVCAAAYKADKHEVDFVILDGLSGAARDDMADCLYPAVKDPQVEERERVIAALIKMRPPSLGARMRELATDPALEATLRGKALAAMGGSTDPQSLQMLTKLLAEDASPEVRAGAAAALVGQKDPAVVAALTQSATTDKEGPVRAAAIASLRQVGSPEVEALVCEAILQDPDAAVRTQATLSYKGTKSDAAMECLRKKSLTLEEDPAAREALLTVLRSSPHPKAGEVICGAIPFFMKSYIQDQGPIKVPGTDIGLAQNARDPDNSYACFQGALRSASGWSCKGRQYVSHWFKEVGGTVTVQKCPGPDGESEIRLE